MKFLTKISATKALSPCGTLMSYDMVNSPNDPALYGFPSGTYYDYSTIYPGVGTFSACPRQDPGKKSS